jgi:hypothetical protein
MRPRPEPDYAAEAAPRRRPWRVALPLILVLVLGLGWTGFWFFAAATAERLIEDWRARQAQAGRVVTCGQQTVGGFPFRIEVRCADAGIELRGSGIPMALRLKEIVALAQVYDPRLLIGEFTGPLQIGAVGQPPELTATWRLAQSSVRGRPSFPERISFAVDDLKVARAGHTELAAQAAHAEFHARLAPAVAGDEPAFDIVLRTTGGTLPELGRLAARPTDSEVVAVLYGLKTLAPKPLAVRLREWQAANGRIEIKSARLKQGETLGNAAGELKLNAQGNLDGELRLTAAGLEHLLPAIGIDRAAGAALSFLGPRAEVEGRPAVSVPLRFQDGTARIGPIPAGRVPAMF